ncbi:uncharacterized protein LOC142343786 [Convolutriloba macropyga]|uniref:uncharacterized protein LOC142343786 n=1 Tax=Convolutriloba macropyga TaxID=536237 RepID=UPI003F523CC5
MLTAFISLCDQKAVSSDVDIGIQLCTKIARRLEKLEAMTKQLRESFSIELRTLLEKGAKSVIDLRGKLDTAWAECQKICSKSNHFLVSQPTDEELANQTKLDLEQLNSWINKIDKDINRKQKSRVRLLDAKHLPQKVFRSRNVEKLRILPNQLNTDLLDFSSIQQLHDTEKWVRINCAKDAEQINASSIEEIWTCFHRYFNATSKLYKNNPELFSILILTCYSFVVILDKKTKAMVPMVANHGLDIDTKVLKYLLLPLSEQNSQLDHVEKYLNERFKGARNELETLLENPASDNSLDVLYASQDQKMLDVREQIQSTARNEEEKKKSEVKREREKYWALIRGTRDLQCEFVNVRRWSGYRGWCQETEHSDKCKLCRLETEAKSMRVNCYKQPLPVSKSGQLAVVFELLCPVEVRVLRTAVHLLKCDVTGFLKKGSRCGRGFWSDLEPLAMYKTNRLNCDVTNWVALTSTSKITTYCGSEHPTEEMSDFIVENQDEILLGYVNQEDIYLSKEFKQNQDFIEEFQDKCVMQAQGSFKSLQWSIRNSTHTDNQVICRQNECPPDISLREFRVFGCVRAGSKIQLRNLVAALHANALPWYSEDVLALVCQVLWEAGSLLTSESRKNDRMIAENKDSCNVDATRDQNVEYLNDDFVVDILRILNAQLTAIQDNWGKNLSLLCLVIFGCRLIELSNLELKTEIAQFLFLARTVGLKWCESIKDKIQQLETVNFNVDSLRQKLAQVALTISCSFAVSEDNLKFVLNSSEHAISWLKSQNTVADNVSLNDRTAADLKFITKLIQKSWKIGLNIKVALMTVLNDNTDLMKEFISGQYSHVNITGNAREMTSWKSMAIADPWLKCELSGGEHMALHPLSGMFLFNNDPVQRLPLAITSHKDYQRIFGSAVLTVATCGTIGSYVTANTINGANFELKIIDAGSLLVTKRIGSQKSFYVPPETFVGHIPYELRQFSHWVEFSTSDNPCRVEFHPITVFDIDHASVQPYKLEQFESHWSLTRVQDGALLLERSNKLFSQLQSKIFKFIEIDDRVHIFFSAKTGVLATLPRLNLSFVLRDNLLQSVEFPGFKVAQNQTLGTLIGLENGIVLESGNVKKFLVPHGNLKEQLLENGHVNIQIELDKLHSPPLFEYCVDENLRRLSPPPSQVACLYLALLHMKTAYPLEDPFTNLTGLEMALYILGRGQVMSCEPLSPRAKQLLTELENCCPQKRLFRNKYKKLAEVETFPSIPSYSMCTIESLRIYCERIREYSQSFEALFPHQTGSQNRQSGNKNVSCIESEDLDCRALYRVKDTMNAVNSKDCDLKELSRSETSNLTEPLIARRPDPINEFVRLFSSMCKSSHWELTVNRDIVSITKMAVTSKNLTGWGFSKLSPGSRINSWINGNASKCLLDLYQLARGGSETFEHLQMMLSYFIYSKQLNVNEASLFCLISKHSEKFASLNPPKYSFYEDFPNRDKPTVTEIEKIINDHFEDCKNFVEKHSRRVGSFSSEKRNELRDKYLKLRPKERHAAVSYVRDAWPSLYCNIPGDFELLDTKRVSEKLSHIFSIRFKNRDLKKFLENVDEIISNLPKVDYDALNIVKLMPFVKNVSNPVQFGTYEKTPNFCWKSKPLSDIRIETMTRSFTSCNEVGIIPKLLLQSEMNEFKACQTNATTNEFSNLDQISSLFADDNGVIDAVSNDFKERFLQSCHLFDKQKAELSTNWIPRIEELHAEMTRAEDEVNFMENVIRKNLEPEKDNFVKIALKRSGIVSRCSFLLLVSSFADRDPECVDSTEDGPLNLLGALLVKWTEKQRLQRCLRHLQNGKTFHLVRELKNPGHTNWVPRDHVEWLILEVENDFMIRPVQVDIALQMLNPPTDVKNAVMQLNMGEGKSRLIVPMLIATISREQKLFPQVIVLNSLYPSNCSYLCAKLGGLLNMRLIRMPFNRDLPLEFSEIANLVDCLKEQEKMGAFIVSIPEHVMSLQLKAVEKFKYGDQKTAEEFKKLLTFIESKFRKILDESDDILSIKRQLVYTIGSQHPLDGHSQRWKVVQSILRSLKSHSKTIFNSYGSENVLSTDETPSTEHMFNHFRLISQHPQCFDQICDLILSDFVSCSTNADLMPLTNNQKICVTEFVRSEILDEVQVDNLEITLGEKIPPSVFLLRGFFGLKILQHCLQLRHRVNYGIGHHRLMAVPFRAKDIAADKTDFGHPDVAIALTQLTYYYQGIPKLGFEKVLLKLSSLDLCIAEAIYAEWVAFCGRNFVPESLQKFAAINSSDQKQFLKLFELFSRHMLVVDFWLENFVYAQEAREFPQKLTATGWDLCRRGKHPVTGFSGTNETQLLLPLTVTQCDLPELEGTNALVIDNLLKEENQCYYALENSTRAEDILDLIVYEQPQVRVILDPGELILEENQKFVSKWLSKVPDAKVAVFFDNNDNIMVLDRNQFVTPFHLSPFC